MIGADQNHTVGDFHAGVNKPRRVAGVHPSRVWTNNGDGFSLWDGQRNQCVERRTNLRRICRVELPGHRWLTNHGLPFPATHYSLQYGTDWTDSASTLNTRSICSWLIQYGGISTMVLPIGRVSTPRSRISMHTLMPILSVSGNGFFAATS